MMPWLPQLEEDCNQLASDAESEDDATLVAIVRISRICMSVAEMNRHLHGNPEYSRHVALHIGPLISELDQLRVTLLAEQAQHTTIAAYIFSAEVSIYELALLQPTNPSLPSSLILDQKRSDYLMACLEACRACTDYYLSCDFLRVSGPIKLLFGYCIKVLYKLSTLQDPMWNSEIVKETVDIIGLLDHCAAAAERANAKLKEETGENSVFLMAAGTLRDMAPDWRVPRADIGMSDATALKGWVGDVGLDMPLMDFSDEFWLNAPFNL